jgi:propane monooxygenase coupling protein
VLSTVIANARHAIAEVMAEKPGITVTYMPAMIRIDDEGRITFKMFEISEAPGRK